MAGEELYVWWDKPRLGGKSGVSADEQVFAAERGGKREGGKEIS